MKKLFSTLWVGLMDFFASIEWPRLQAWLNNGEYYKLSIDDHNRIRDLLAKHHAIIFTRRDCHLTTYLIALVSFFLSGKCAHYAHVLMNVEDTVTADQDYFLVEAIGDGVTTTPFMKVFDCDSVAICVPRNVTPEQWTKAMEYAIAQLGKPYDDFFNIKNDDAQSCIELVYWALKTLPDFEQRFPKLIKMIQTKKNLTPQMLYDSGELDVIYEVRR